MNRRIWSAPMAALVVALSTLSLLSLCAAAEKSAAKTVFPKPLNIAVLVYDGVEILDASGPLDVFGKANQMAPHSYNVFTVAPRKMAVTVQGGAFKMEPEYSFDNSPTPDILVVPGASMETIETMGKNVAFETWIASRTRASRLTMSVCTGAFLLARAGVLDGRRATTHWFVTDEFQKQFPKVHAREGVRFVEDGKFVTAAGVSSGIDGALHVVEKISGKSVADMVARALQYRRDTPAFPDANRRAVVVSTPVAPQAEAQTLKGKLVSDSDPVCGMNLDAHPKFTAAHSGKIYGFCSSRCRDKFLAHPENYTNAATTANR